MQWSCDFLVCSSHVILVCRSHVICHTVNAGQHSTLRIRNFKLESLFFLSGGCFHLLILTLCATWLTVTMWQLSYMCLLCVVFANSQSCLDQSSPSLRAGVKYKKKAHWDSFLRLCHLAISFF